MWYVRTYVRTNKKGGLRPPPPRYEFVRSTSFNSLILSWNSPPRRVYIRSSLNSSSHIYTLLPPSFFSERKKTRGVKSPQRGGHLDLLSFYPRNHQGSLYGIPDINPKRIDTKISPLEILVSSLRERSS